MSAMESAVQTIVKEVLKEPGHSPFETGEETELERKVMRTIHMHSVGAAISAIAAGLIPGVGALIATCISGGAVWKMYFSINSILKIKFSKHLIQTMASAIGANIVQYIAATLLLNTVLSFIPGLNIWGCAALVMACYVAVYASAYIYILLLTSVFKSGASLSELSKLSEEEIKAKTKDIMENVDMDKVIKEGKAGYKQAKDSGEIKE